METVKRSGVKKRCREKKHCVQSWLPCLRPPCSYSHKSPPLFYYLKAYIPLHTYLSLTYHIHQPFIYILCILYAPIIIQTNTDNCNIFIPYPTKVYPAQKASVAGNTSNVFNSTNMATTTSISQFFI